MLLPGVAGVEGHEEARVDPVASPPGHKEVQLLALQANERPTTQLWQYSVEKRRDEKPSTGGSLCWLS